MSTQKIQRKIDKAIERRDALVEQQQELEVPPARKADLVSDRRIEEDVSDVRSAVDLDLQQIDALIAATEAQEKTYIL